MSFIRTSAYVLLTGYILAFFSEWMFWSGRPLDPELLVNLLPTWLLYSFVTFLFLATVQYFRVRSLWAVFLAGAEYGWLLEGVVVQTSYDNFPLNISFTALAWHTIISVVVGWYFLRRLMRRGEALSSVCILLGLCLGVWSVGWWTETPAAPIESVFVYNFGFALGLVGAYVGQSRLSFKPNRYVVYAAIALLAVYFLFITVPTQPLALVVMPILLIVTLVTLRRNRRDEPEFSTDYNPAPLTLRSVLPLMLIPLIASLFYGFALMRGLNLPGLQIAYVILTPVGFLLFFVSIYKVWKRPRNSLEEF